MARPLRIELADGYYHVMNRGNNRQGIFMSDKDRKAFMEALADSCEIYHVEMGTCVLYFHLRNNRIRRKDKCVRFEVGGKMKQMSLLRH